MVNKDSISLKATLPPLLLIVCLSIIRWQYGVLLFHTLAELFSAVVGILMLVVVWNTRLFIRNDFLVYLGIGYFWIAVLDTFHTFAVEGMPFFSISDSEVTLHFWIYTRFIEAMLLLTASFFLQKRLNAYGMFYAGATLVGLVTWGSFAFKEPVMLTPEGLTAFKVATEYVVITLLVLSIVIYIWKRDMLVRPVLHYLLTSIILTIFAELSFTLYTDFQGVPFVAGHLFKFLSFWMIYQAIVQTALKEPFSVLAQASSSYDAIPQPAVVVDRHGIISQVNRAAERYSGESSQRLLHQPVHRFFHPSDVSEKACVLCLAIREGRAIRKMASFPGQKQWALISLSPIAVGDVTRGMVQSTTDFTDRKLAEDALRKSQTHLQTLIETLPDLVWLKDPEGVYLTCNQKFERYFGAKKAEIIGKTDYDFVDKELADFFREKDKMAMATGKPSVNEEEITFADDCHNAILETIKTPMFDTDGKLVGVVGVGRDITERKQAEAALRESGQQVKDLLDSTAEAIYGLDMRGECTFANPACVRMLGYRDADELIGRNMHHLIHHKLPDGILYPVDECRVFRAFQSGESVHVDTEVFWRADGSSFSAEYWSYPIHRDNEVVGAVVTFLDITERRQAEQALRRAQKMDAVGQLTGGIAHDFNNILGIILGNLELLEHSLPGDAKTLKRVGTIRKSAQRAADLTEQLLGFSRHQSAKIAVTDIRSVIRDMDSMIARSVTPEVSVEHLFAESLWLTEIDPGDFKDALLNLIINARDAMPGGGRLTLEAHNCTLDTAYCAQNPGAKPGEYVQLAVSDNGEGIPHEQKEHIFEPFFTTKPKGKGTGLGLAMVYGFVKRSEGYVEAYSEQDIGTTFRLYLPRIEGEEQWLEATGERLESSPRGTETLLAVDDEEWLLEVAQESLQALGYRVLSATNGRQALQQLAEHTDISLLFSDVVMPGGMNGYELAEQATASRPDLKVLLTSGYTEKAVDHNGEARLDAHLLSKPYTQSELAQRVRALLGEAELSD